MPKPLLQLRLIFKKLLFMPENWWDCLRQMASLSMSSHIFVQVRSADRLDWSKISCLHKNSYYGGRHGGLCSAENRGHSNTCDVFVQRSSSLSSSSSQVCICRTIFQWYHRIFILILAHEVNAYYYFVTREELRVHFEPTIWREYAAPGKEHPMSQVIFDVKAIYGKFGSKTKVMPASIVTPREVTILIFFESPNAR